jgi:hypothetical protein
VGSGGIEAVFLTWALEWSASRSFPLYLGGKARGPHWIGGWVSPKAGLDDMQKRKILFLPGIEPRQSDCLKNEPVGSKREKGGETRYEKKILRERQRRGIDISQ